MSPETTTFLVSRIGIAAIELLVLGGVVGLLLLVFRGISPLWRRRIWLLVLCKPIATVVTASWGGFIVLPHFTSQSLLHDVLFPNVSGGQVIAPEGVLGRLVSLLAFVWLAGALVLLGRLWCRLQASRRLVDESREKGYLLKPGALRRMNPNLRIPPEASIIVTPEDHGPVTVGASHPVVIIPEALLPWVLRHDDPTRTERDRLCQVIRHELAHIAHRDYLLSLAGHVIVDLFWFHPVAHLAYRRFRINCELCCDANVVRSGASATAYVDTLMSVVAGKFARCGIAPRMVGDYKPASVLRRRLQYLLSEYAPDRSRRPVAAWCIAVLLVAAMPKFVACARFIEVRFADGHVEAMRLDNAAPLLDAGVVALVDRSNLPPELRQRWAQPVFMMPSRDTSTTSPVDPFATADHAVQLAAADATEQPPEINDDDAGEQTAQLSTVRDTAQDRAAPAPRRQIQKPGRAFRVRQPNRESPNPLLGRPGNR